MKKGNSVRVKQGILDPDLEKYDMSGWQGRIIDMFKDEESGETICEIAWDSITLKAIPKAFIENSMEEGYDFHVMNLSPDDIELALERDTLADVEAVLEALETAYEWAEFGEQGARIQAVLESADEEEDLLDTWFDFLNENVKFPFKATFEGDSSNVLKNGATVEVVEITEIEEDYGILATIKTADNESFLVPLCDLSVNDVTEKTQAADDYATWFVNA